MARPKRNLQLNTKPNQPTGARAMSITKRTQQEIAIEQGNTVRREVAFIDRTVDDLAALLAGLRPDVEPILLEASEPATAQIARATQARAGVTTIHVVAHGSPGAVNFGAGA